MGFADRLIRVAAVALALTAVTPALSQEAPVRIGYAISRTGPFAAGAQISQEPNFILWAEQVNAAGGLNVMGKRRKVELVARPGLRPLARDPERVALEPRHHEEVGV